ncbi:MAG: PemK family transcriptional regulator [Acidobacteria bacterium RIFCSPLOWO2_02_FULL_61_28]|nr:MAG: PemK family transcriptional regulator [Acidobacteria bacterium RIFCSPLOWO2_02_FULL_61_28]
MAERRTVAFPKRGEIYLVSFDPTVGAEIRKTRPALVLQNNVANRHSPVTIVAAITSRFEEPLYPTEVLLPAGEGGLEVDSVVLLNQVRTVDRLRLIERLGMLKPETLKRVNQALRISMGLAEV